MPGSPHPTVVSSELYRLGLGVIAPDAAIAAALTAGRSPLHNNLISVVPEGLSVEDASDALHQIIERAFTQALVGDSSPAGVVNECLPHLGMNRLDRAGRTLYVDVSCPGDTSRRFGIPFPIEELALSLAREFSGRTFLTTRRGSGFAHDTGLLENWAQVGRQHAPDLPATAAVRVREGDILFQSGLCDPTQDWTEALAGWKARGGVFVQVVTDLLPLAFEDFYPQDRSLFEHWLTTVATHADLLVCYAREVAADLESWISHQPVAGTTRPAVAWIPLGCVRSGMGGRYPEPLRTRDPGRSRVLVIGTVEPRMGVEVVMDAAEALWSRGEDVEFTILGSRGWMMPTELSRLRALNDSDAPFTWVTHATAARVRSEYKRADLLVASSRGEGVGLPIVEALAHGVPVLARDIPVFRELLGPRGDYFVLDGELPQAIITRVRSRAPIAYTPERLVTWEESAQDLLTAIDTVTRRQV